MACPAPNWAGTLVQTVGPRDLQVIQRDAAGVAELYFEGRSQGLGEGEVQARVMYGQPALARWRSAGRVSAQGEWTARISGVPAGGPYAVELRSSGAYLRIGQVMVGDLWILAGQSNMEGYGLLDSAEQPDERVRSFDMADSWAVAREPLHETVAAVDSVHWPRSAAGEPLRHMGARLEAYRTSRRRGAGLGLPFAKEIVRRTGVPIGLIPCAHGGTRMDQWEPTLASDEGASLYGAMLRRFNAVGGRVAGVLWYQGESDAQPGRVDEYEAKLTRLVESVRRDFGQPELPFLLVQIGRNIATQVPHNLEWAAAQEIQRRLPEHVPHTSVTASVDLELEDDVHVDTAGLKRLGARLARLALGGNGPRPVSAVIESGGVRVHFKGVNGNLRSAGRPAGFTLHGPDGSVLPVVSKTILDRTSVLLRVQGKLLPGAVVRYGFGRDPYCNVTDDADMPVPAFGPLRISSSDLDEKPPMHARTVDSNAVQER